MRKKPSGQDLFSFGRKFFRQLDNLQNMIHMLAFWIQTQSRILAGAGPRLAVFAPLHDMGDVFPGLRLEEDVPFVGKKDVELSAGLFAHGNVISMMVASCDFSLTFSWRNRRSILSSSSPRRQPQ